MSRTKTCKKCGKDYASLTRHEYGHWLREHTHVPKDGLTITPDNMAVCKECEMVYKKENDE